MSAKPTLGYPSRTEAVQGLRGQGLSTRQIAEAIGIEVKTVVALEHSSGRKRMPRPAEQMGRTIVFPTDVLDSLQPHAARRGIHVNSLARLIVTTVVDDNLVDSVLDDAADIDGWTT
jgi:hypothetical protein